MNSNKINEFRCLLKASGLSGAKSAEYLNVRPDTVRSWTCGRNNIPDNAIDKMKFLVSKIDDLVANNITDIDKMNLPNINCCRVVLGRIIAKN